MPHQGGGACPEQQSEERHVDPIPEPGAVRGKQAVGRGAARRVSGGAGEGGRAGGGAEGGQPAVGGVATGADHGVVCSGVDGGVGGEMLGIKREEVQQSATPPPYRSTGPP